MRLLYKTFVRVALSLKGRKKKKKKKRELYGNDYILRNKNETLMVLNCY